VGSAKAREGRAMLSIMKNLIVATRVEQRSVRSEAVVGLMKKQ
jgi:hypothetical protein